VSGQAWLPNAAQELLLQIALGESAERVERDWARWKSLALLADVDGDSFQILPLAYRNLTLLGIDDAELTKLRGIYRYTWSRHQLLLRTGGEAISALTDSGIGTMILKGAALGLAHYRDLGVRTMFDFDLLVPPDRVLEAMNVLNRNFSPDPPAVSPQHWLPVRHSTAYRDAAGREIDLHWYSLWHSAPDDDFWEASLPAQISGVETRVLCPTDQLLQVLAHGAWWSSSARLRWVADAVTVIRTSGDEGIDWERFGDRARAHCVAPNLVAPLTYLCERFGQDVPEETLRGLRRARPSLLERAARRAGRAPTNAPRQLVMHFERYRRVRSMNLGPSRPRSFASSVGTWVGCETYPDLAVYATKQLLRGQGLSRAEDPSLAS
jgi:hypothetical protein